MIVQVHIADRQGYVEVVVTEKCVETSFFDFKVAGELFARSIPIPRTYDRERVVYRGQDHDEAHEVAETYFRAAGLNFQHVA